MQQKLSVDKSYCIQQANFNYSFADLPKPLYQQELDTLLTKRISWQSLNTANAIGLLPMLKEYVILIDSYQKQPSLEKRINLMDISQRISRKINIASLDISAVASELDCEEERAAQFAYFLKEKEGTIENNLVIGSIIVGAASTIVGESLSDTKYGNSTGAIAIGSSLIETALGVLMLTNKKKIIFKHPINPLTDIWKAPKVSTYYPPSIWYYLTNADSVNNMKPLAKLLTEKWMLFGQIADVKDKKREAVYELYFGKGGKYSAGQLKNRADMLDQIEAYITLMKQNLRGLSTEVDAIYP